MMTLSTILATLASPIAALAQSEAAHAASQEAGHAAEHVAHAAEKIEAIAAPGVGPMWLLLIPVLPLVGFVLSALCAAFRVKSKLPAWLTVLCLGASFAVTLGMYLQVSSGQIANPSVATGFEWIKVAWGAGDAHSIIANFGLYIDSLTCLWMLFVTGLATLIGLYASEYMAGDVGAGYCRFYAAFNLFVFSMSCLVMGDNLLLLYLGWEGVGLCSYLLIGYFYKKPSAVEAGKKAFIVNRIGDLGLALGLMLTAVHFGSIEYSVIFAKAQPYLAALSEGRLGDIPAVVQLIPVLLMIGAFGKSAQLPLYVWLPDAMEGPTPVSALIHAATMVTAGVYLVARAYPLFLLSETALPIVAWTGALTALLAATIGMAQFDIKRIMAYSTVSQLGYMFAGLGVLTSTGAAFHVFTHAFFKAMLFLSCGAVMHGFAGQLDLRKLSGVGSMPGWRVVGIAMLVGCLNLAGFPVITSGYWSKDMILGGAFANPHMVAIGWILLITAGLTAYYTFRVYFRVFVGPKYFEPGDEVHGHAGDDHGHDHGHDHAHADHGDRGHGHDAHAHFHPHAPGWAINTVLAILAVAAFAVIGLRFVGGHEGWVSGLIEHSSANYGGHAMYAAAASHGGEHAHATFFGYDAHQAMMYVSGVVGFIGIAVAFVLHYAGRTTAAKSRADALLPLVGPLAKWAQGKWYVDELYNAIIRVPLLVAAHVFHLIDKAIVDGIVDLFGWVPKFTGSSLRPSQSGVLHGYALSMAGGLAVLVLIVVMVMR
ncbi:MAG: NADH-quinone oxidoreductase subunit L [Phycisphaerales bacterium]|nr:NADH-quinone oxidoreductase subunit L [Phycisphaerales bacterium]